MTREGRDVCFWAEALRGSMGLTVSFPSALRTSSVPAWGCSEPGLHVRCRMEAHPHWANTRSLGRYHPLLLQSGGGSCHSSPELLDKCNTAGRAHQPMYSVLACTWFSWLFWLGAVSLKCLYFFAQRQLGVALSGVGITQGRNLPSRIRRFSSLIKTREHVSKRYFSP